MSDVMVLRVDNQELRERVEGLMLDLSIKEAKWCETEESLKIKVNAMVVAKFPWLNGRDLLTNIIFP